MLPFHMLAALPIRSSIGLDPIVPLFPSLLSVTSATSALKSPRSLTTKPVARKHQPNHFPLFPHPVNIARAATPTTPFASTIYFTVLWIPGGGVLAPLSRRVRTQRSALSESQVRMQLF